MKNFWKEFKKFITRGNIIDLAIAVVIGGAFGKIVTSLGNDIIIPLVGMATGGINIADLKWVIRPAVTTDGVITVTENAIRYGQFIQNIVDFLIIALFIFIALRLFLKAQKKITEFSEKEIKRLIKKGIISSPEDVPAPAPAPETTEDILKDIRNLLKKDTLQSNEKKNKKSLNVEKNNN